MAPQAKPEFGKIGFIGTYTQRILDPPLSGARRLRQRQGSCTTDPSPV
jgi:hypothetical protein